MFGDIASSAVQQLGDVQALAAGEIADLCPAAEPVGDDERVVAGLLDVGDQDPVGAGDGDVVLVVLARGS